jgi:hypothetical protein
VTGAQTITFDVIDNTTSTVLLSCTINTTTSLSTRACRNTGTAAVPAGDYLMVRVTLGGAAPKKAYRASFRF